MKKGIIKNKLKRFGRVALFVIPVALGVAMGTEAVLCAGEWADSASRSSKVNSAIDDSILLHNFANDANATQVLNNTLATYELDAKSYEDALIYSRAVLKAESSARVGYGLGFLAAGATAGLMGFAAAEIHHGNQIEREEEKREEAKRIAAEEEARAILKKKEEEEELNADK